MNDLNPLLARLNAAFPGSGFGGRSAAGGSKIIAPLDAEAVVREIAGVLQS